MVITTPLALLLFVCLPVIIYIGWPRHHYRRVRDWASLILRIVMVTLVVLALAGVQIAQSADRLSVVFLVDVSDSMGQSARQAQLDYIRESLQHMGPDDEVGIVLFGGNALVERPLSNLRELEEIRSTPVTSNTDLAEAIWLGLSMFPANTARRMVVLSDGQPTVGDTDAAARRAAAEGVEISYVPFYRQPAPEVQLTSLNAPSAVNEGQLFDLNLTVEAQAATPATITILASGEIIHRENVSLREGTNNYTLTLQSGGAGFRDFQARVDPQGNDSFYQNNLLSTFSSVVGAPRVLLVTSDATGDETRYLTPALQEAGLTVDQATPNSLPIGVAALAQYKSVMLVNVPASRLTTQRMQTLESYVKDLGGGLVVIGGPEAYGPGGYFQTPLENVLPVEMQIRDQQRLPQLTIAYVIDRSGSMGAEVGGVVAIDLAKEAMIRSIDFLQPSDRAAVVSFDTVGYWVAPFQQIYDRQALQRLIATLRASGGTDILAGMQLTAAEIVNEPSQRKHIILLTDGGAAPTGLVELADQLYKNAGVTTSVIAIGPGAADFLGDMAAAGHGKYHKIEDAASIPTIFTAETVLASRSYILEKEFVPTLTANSPIMQGILSAPPLLGYVAATPKVASQVILRGPEPYSDPVLASWQYGLGRAVAFTSDATARWAVNWVQWPDFSRFWSQAVRWTITEGAVNNLEARVVMENEQARVIVDARDDKGAFLNGLNLEMRVVYDPQKDALHVPLRQVAPGRYEGVFTPEAEGAYFMRLTGAGLVDGSPIQVNQTTGWVMSYSPEYQIASGASQDGEALLSGLAALTGGRSLAGDTSGVFLHNLTARNATAPLWPALLLAALLLLPLDIALRRLVITRTDLQRLAAWFKAAIPRRQFATEGPSERMTSLMDARERARRRVDEQATAESTIRALRARREETRTEREVLPPATPAAVTPDNKPRYPRQPEPVLTAEDPDDNVAGRLLKRRKGGDKTE